ncbi:MAG TPA: tetratricopeptide repeat protein [candidate division WOR-3 bacterium]|uniref:Tetratricopeptide repeat protein n=1 Tax=candidate division WOR-3 bacterium TaxID=2052148 RepID=A0A7C5HG57_UNCW3|nr:tetratricopeptide repeat protein [candidate division WOR-3 bacterium]
MKWVLIETLKDTTDSMRAEKTKKIQDDLQKLDSLIQSNLSVISEQLPSKELVLFMGRLSRRHPDNVLLRLQLGRVFMKINDLDRAEIMFKKVLNMYPQSFVGHYFLAEVYKKKKNYDAALNEYEIARKLNPTDEDVLKKMVNIVPEKEQSRIIDELGQELKAYPERTFLQKYISLLKEKYHKKGDSQ